MMRPGQVLGLIAAGVALTGSGLWLVSRHVADSALDAQGPVLPLKQDALNSVTALRIFKGDGSHATLTRAATGWIVAERGFPADTGQVRKLLLDLSGLQAEEQKTRDPTLYPKLGVEDPSGVQSASTGVAIDSTGSTVTLIVGKTFGTAGTFVRVAGQAQSLLATPQLTPDADPRHWLDRSLLDIAPDQVIEADVTPPQGPGYAVKRASQGSTEYRVDPLPKGRELSDPSAPASQAGALAGLQLDDVRKAAADAAVAHASFRTSDGVVIVIAGHPQNEQRYISISVSGDSAAAQQRARELNARLSGWEFEIPGYRYETLFRPLEQLLKPKATPAPAALPFGPGNANKGGNKATPEQSHKLPSATGDSH